MAQHSTELKATARPRAGKGAARQARREGKVPGVIYGDGQPPETIALDYNDLWKQVIKGHFTSTVFELDVDGKKSRVIPRDLQVDPVKDLPIHVDFHAHRQRRPHPRRGSGALHQRGAVAGPEARRRLEHRAPRRRGHLPLRPHPGLLRGRPRRVSRSAARSTSRPCSCPKDAELTIKDRDFTVATIAGAVKQEEEAPAAAAAAPAEGAAAARRRRRQGRCGSRQGRGARQGRRAAGGGQGRGTRGQGCGCQAAQEEVSRQAGARDHRAPAFSSAPGHAHEALRRSGKPGRAVRPPPPQRRLHGARQDRRARTASAPGASASRARRRRARSAASASCC